MKLYLFDFDGTLTTGDSLLAVLVFAVGWPRFFLKMPVVATRFMAIFFQKKWSAKSGKAALLSVFFKK